MNNPNPFVPKGSLLEQQSQRRSRLKIAVFCVLGVSVTGLVLTLIEGCKREAPDTSNNPPPLVDTNPPPLEFSNTPPVTDTNPPPMPPPMAPGSNGYAMQPPPQPPALPPTEPLAGPGTEYVVVAGDTLAKIAKAQGVTVKALEAANPGVDPKKLKVKQKLNIPPSTRTDSTSTSPMPIGTTDTTGGASYVVKSGDTLTKIAKKHGVSLKALKAANNLTTDHIKVGEKLTIPAKAETTAPTPPDTGTVPPPPAPNPQSLPGPTPTPAPAH